MLKTSRMSLSHCLLSLPLPFSHLSFPSRWSVPGPPLFSNGQKYLSFKHFVFILRLFKQLCLRPRILRMYHAQSKLSWQLIFLMNSLNFWRRLSLKILSSVTTGREALLKLLERLRVMNRKENKQLKTVQNNSYGQNWRETTSLSHGTNSRLPFSINVTLNPSIH